MLAFGIILLAAGMVVLAVTQICLQIWLKKYKQSWEDYYEVR